MENIERPAEVTKAQAQVMTEKNQQKYDQDQFEKIYDYLDGLNTEASGSVKQVLVSQTQTSGVEIGGITVDGQETKLYAPESAGLFKLGGVKTLSKSTTFVDFNVDQSQAIDDISGYTPVAIAYAYYYNDSLRGFYGGRIYKSGNTYYVGFRVRGGDTANATTFKITYQILYVKSTALS